jgi:hypothetical protein
MIGINVSRTLTLIRRHRLALCIILLMRLALAKSADKIRPTPMTISQTVDIQAMDRPRKDALLPSKVIGIMAQAKNQVDRNNDMATIEISYNGKHTNQTMIHAVHSPNIIFPTHTKYKKTG